MQPKVKSLKSVEEVLKILLENRGIRTKRETEEFLNPDLTKVTPKNTGINLKELKKGIARIERATKNKEQIVIFGDYDADGLCASAILWETLNNKGAKVLPYIPDRVEEGYGISEKAIENLVKKLPQTKLIITVDNGIVANEEVDLLNKRGIDVIITDHHLPGEKIPNALAVIHSTKLSGAGVAFLLSKEIEKKSNDYLDLVTIATVADLVPLTLANRTLVTFGIKALRKTKRTGLLELINEAGIELSKIGTYDIGHIIAPRLNAMGRVGNALDSLRLLCTKDKKAAKSLAQKLGRINKKRQDLTYEAMFHAVEKVKRDNLKDKKLLFVADENYQQGIIGLVAGRLTEEFYRPSIVISKGKKFSKASARSVKGFNVIEFIRRASEFLTAAGGHPMAAGFTVETVNLEKLKQKLEKLAEKFVEDKHLIRAQRIDCQIPMELVTDELFRAIKKLEPFGMDNPLPVFLSEAVIKDLRFVGKNGKHIKFIFSSSKAFRIDGIGFGIGEKYEKLNSQEKVMISYVIDENEWNGNKKLQLKIRDFY
jgi:single-stranded-DNA-specific exonuclease